MPAVPTSPLIALDDALLDLQRLLRRPGYRARILRSLGSHVEISTVRVLRAVERAGATPPSVGDIAERLMIDPSTASRFVEHQVEAGYLTRARHPDDRRRSQLVLTDAGQALLDAITEARRELLAEITTDWDPDDIERLSDLMTRLRDGFDRLEGTA